MHAKRIVLWSFVTAIVAVMVFSPGIVGAGSMTLKVSHQFAAGDVRDQMARVFGDKVTEMTKGEIKFRIRPNHCTNPKNNGMPCAKGPWTCRYFHWIMLPVRSRNSPSRSCRARLPASHRA